MKMQTCRVVRAEMLTSLLRIWYAERGPALCYVPSSFNCTFIFHFLTDMLLQSGELKATEESIKSSPLSAETSQRPPSPFFVLQKPVFYNAASKMKWFLNMLPFIVKSWWTAGASASMTLCRSLFMLPGKSPSSHFIQQQQQQLRRFHVVLLSCNVSAIINRVCFRVQPLYSLIKVILLLIKDQERSGRKRPKRRGPRFYLLLNLRSSNSARHVWR